MDAAFMKALSKSKFRLGFINDNKASELPSLDHNVCTIKYLPINHFIPIPHCECYQRICIVCIFHIRAYECEVQYIPCAETSGNPMDGTVCRKG